MSLMAGSGGEENASLFLDTPPEMRVIFCIAHARLSASDIEYLTTLLQNNLNWTFLIDAVVKHGLWPLLNRHLKQISTDIVRMDVREALREAAVDYEAAMLKRVRDLHRLLDGFHEAGLDPIPYKGPVLAERLYGHYALRLYGDLDFLVQPEEVGKVYTYLAARGFHTVTPIPPGWQSWYEKNCHEHAFSDLESDLFVELHWGAWQRFLGMPVDVRSFWKHRETVNLEGRTVQSLGMEELLFLLSLHGTKHQWNRLSWLADVTEILRATPELDWVRVWSLAEESGTERFLSIGLWLAHHLLNAPLPPEVLQRVQVDRQVVRLAGKIGRSLCSGVMHESTEIEHLRFIYRTLPRFRDRLRFLWGVAVEPCRDDWRLCLLPPSLKGLYAIIRPSRLIGLVLKGILFRKNATGKK
jgi:hypothetical protein